MLIIAAMFVVIGPVAGIIVAVALLGLCFLTLYRILIRFRAAWKAAKNANEVSSP